MKEKNRANRRRAESGGSRVKHSKTACLVESRSNRGMETDKERRKDSGALGMGAAIAEKT